MSLLKRYMQTVNNLKTYLKKYFEYPSQVFTCPWCGRTAISTKNKTKYYCPEMCEFTH